MSLRSTERNAFVEVWRDDDEARGHLGVTMLKTPYTLSEYPMVGFTYTLDQKDEEVAWLFVPTIPGGAGGV